MAILRKWASKLLLFKTESSYGANALPTAAANYVEARNVSLTAYDAETIDRNIETPVLGSNGKLVMPAWAKLSFEVAYVPGGALGLAPQWGPLLLACGFAQTVVAAASVTYNLVSTAFSSGTATLNIDGILYQFLGCRGDVKISLGAKGIPLFKFDFTSTYTVPADSALPTPTRTGWMIEEAVHATSTSAVSINGIALPFSALDLGPGNKISKIDLPGPQREAVIVDRSASCSLTVLAPTMAVFNPYALAAANAATTLIVTHGTAVGSKIQAVVRGTLTNISEDQVDGIAAYKLTFDPRPISGNDEIALVCV